MLQSYNYYITSSILSCLQSPQTQKFLYSSVSFAEQYNIHWTFLFLFLQTTTIHIKGPQNMDLKCHLFFSFISHNLSAIKWSLNIYSSLNICLSSHLFIYNSSFGKSESYSLYEKHFLNSSFFSLTKDYPYYPSVESLW